MNAARKKHRLLLCLGLLASLSFSRSVRAEYEEEAQYVDEREMVQEQGKTDNGFRKSTKKSRRTYYNEQQQKRKYFIPDPQRVDAGTFHVAFGAGGNFYIEPKFDSNGAAIGDYFKDFGFQGGVYFDYDYEDMRLGLRGWVGYKYVLNSVHVFGFEGRVRYLFTMSENVKFGLDMGVSGAMWLRTITSTSNQEEALFLPAFIIGAGFDFNPFMVDFKTLINRIGQNSTILGLELTFGFRL
ncbi:MAG: hypothetical protein KDD51_16025 [Bdellovibrionales bacterium]|nr:hypothetical protein [Bdellovibrionales bacterium]